MISSRILFLAAVLCSLFALAPAAIAQDAAAKPQSSAASQPASLGDAARKAQAEKKPAAKHTKVFTNEDMGNIKDTPSSVKKPSVKQPGAASAAKKPAQSQSPKLQPASQPQ